jgi:putative transposase
MVNKKSKKGSESKNTTPIVVSKFRAFPTKSTEKYLLKITELNRLLYNDAIIERRNAYAHSGKSLSYIEQSYHIKTIKRDIAEYSEINAQLLHSTLKRVQTTYDRFFATQKKLRKTGQPLTHKGRLIGYPKLKKRGDFSTITYQSSGWRLDQEKRILLLTSNKGVLGKIKYLSDHKIVGDIKNISITKSKTNKWWIQIIYETTALKDSPFTGRVVGIDLGVKSLVVDSDGKVWGNPRFLKYFEDRISTWQAKRDNVPKNDNKKEKYQRAENRLHEKLTNKRKQLAREIAAYYANNYDIVCMEALDVSKLSRKKKTKDLTPQNTRTMDQAKNKQVYNAGLGQIRSMIKNACDRRGKMFIEVDPAYTSQTCSKCGSRNSAMGDVSEREFFCPSCDNVMDRDYNAALNILRRGERGLRTAKAA